jgi:hypothetical protein
VVRFEDKGGLGKYISVLPVEAVAAAAEKKPAATAAN